MATDKAIAKALKSACLEVSVELKEHQRNSIEAILKRKDVFTHWLWKIDDIPSFAFMFTPSWTVRGASYHCRSTPSFINGGSNRKNKRNTWIGRAIQLTGGLPDEGELDGASFMFTSVIEPK
jgi:hypothetical protein